MSAGDGNNAKYYGIEYENSVRQRMELARYLSGINYEKYDFFVHQAGLARGATDENALKNSTNPTPERGVIENIMEYGLSVYPYATISETTNLVKEYKNVWELADNLLNYTYNEYINGVGGAGEYKEVVNVIMAIPKTVELMPDGVSEFDDKQSTISVPFSRIVPEPKESCSKYFPINDVMYANQIHNIRPEFVLGVTCAGVDGVRPATFFNERFLDELSPNEYNEKMKYWGELMKSHYGIHVPNKDAEENNLYIQYDTPHSATEKVVSGTLHSYAKGSFARGSYMDDFDFD